MSDGRESEERGGRVRDQFGQTRLFIRVHKRGFDLPFLASGTRAIHDSI